ncbi:MAG: hypothetical protein Q9213_004671 [Squamulea squamosa]
MSTPYSTSVAVYLSHALPASFKKQNSISRTTINNRAFYRFQKFQMPPHTKFCLKYDFIPESPVRHEDIHNCLDYAWEQIRWESLPRKTPGTVMVFRDYTTELEFAIKHAFRERNYLRWYHVKAALRGLKGYLTEHQSLHREDFGEFRFVLSNGSLGRFATGFLKRIDDYETYEHIEVEDEPAEDIESEDEMEEDIEDEDEMEEDIEDEDEMEEDMANEDVTIAHVEDFANSSNSDRDSKVAIIT